nr:IS630 family transposase [Enterococcus hulanensis]
MQKNKKRLKSNYLGIKKVVDTEDTILLFEDESTIRDYQALMKSWFPKGKQRVIPTYGKHLSVKLLGVLNYEIGEIFVQETEKFDAVVFQKFLEGVLAQYPTGHILMVLDNARVHHAKKLQPFLSEHPRLELVFLPPYSPNLNPIEGLWRWLKDCCINNVFYDKFYQIVLSVREFVQWVNTVPQMTIDRLCS